MKENKEMKSRFAYGMFAGFALAFVFFFLFFLFFFPSAFRAVTVKNPSGYQSAVYGPASLTNAAPELPNAYYDGQHVAYYEPESPYGSYPLVSTPTAYNMKSGRVNSPQYHRPGITAYANPASPSLSYYPGYQIPDHAPAYPAA